MSRIPSALDGSIPFFLGSTVDACSCIDFSIPKDSTLALIVELRVVGALFVLSVAYIDFCCSLRVNSK